MGANNVYRIQYILNSKGSLLEKRGTSIWKNRLSIAIFQIDLYILAGCAMNMYHFSHRVCLR